MSLTKILRKKLPGMSYYEKVHAIGTLESLLVSEKNPMVKSSLRERIQILKSSLVI